MGFLSALAAMAHTRLESRPPGEEEAQRRVGVQALFHGLGELFADLGIDGGQVVGHIGLHRGEVGEADELAVGIVVAGREGIHLIHQSHQFFASLAKTMSPWS